LKQDAVMLIGSGRSEAPDAAEVERAPVLLEAGWRAEGEFRCAECGYGVMVKTVLPACPMCRGVAWEAPVDGSFAR
jgi:rubrerythrin